MSPIPAQGHTEEERAGEPAGIRRGRHRKPRPRKVLLAAGGLALAAGVFSLVRVAPESGVGAPGTAEAESRPGTGGGATDHAANTATTATDPTALPSATSVMGGRNPMPTATGPAGATTAPIAPATTPDRAVVPAETPLPAGPPANPGTTPQPPATKSAPRPAPTTARPSPATPTPTHSTDPGPGGLCIPVLGLCVDGPSGH